MIRRDYIIGVFVPQLEQFSRMFTETVLPPFADPEAQAEKARQDYWDQKMAEPCGPDGPEEDFGDIADDAQQKGIEFYQTMHALHYTVINLFTAGLFHLFEQQAASLVKDWTGERPKYPVIKLKHFVWESRHRKVVVQKAPMWADLDELHLVANVVKHAEGDSAKELRALNPAHFELPEVRGTDLEEGEHRLPYMLGEPLTGEGLWVVKADYDRFATATTGFWNWLADGMGQ